MRITSKVGPYATLIGIIIAVVQTLIDAAAELPIDLFPDLGPILPLVITVFGLAVTLFGWSADLGEGLDFLDQLFQKPILHLVVSTLAFVANAIVTGDFPDSYQLFAYIVIAIASVIGVEASRRSFGRIMLAKGKK